MPCLLVVAKEYKNWIKKVTNYYLAPGLVRLVYHSLISFMLLM